MSRPSDIEQKPGFNVPKIYDGMEMRQNSASDQWAGRSTIASGDTTVTVSTTNVKSDSLVFATLHLPVGSYANLEVSVHSLVDGGFITFGTELATSDSQNFNWFTIRNLTS